MQTFIIALVQQSSDGLTLREVVADIPHDPAAIFVYVLLLVSVLLIVRGSRQGGRKSGGSA